MQQWPRYYISSKKKWRRVKNYLKNGRKNAMKKMNKKFKVKITWGVTSWGDAQTKTYEFKTEKEMDAFLYGVDESNGWLSYDIAIYPK